MSVRGVRSDRLLLHVVAGTRPRLVLHDVGASPVAPDGDGAWRYHQRGHGASGRVAGGAYGFDDMAVDLLRVLATIGPAVTVEAHGASTVVAALAAVARPGAVAAIEVRSGTGWGSWPTERLVGPTWAPNPHFRARTSTGATPSDVDPNLALGPPELTAVAPLAADLAALPCPWSAAAAGLHDLLLPAHRRADAPPPTPSQEEP